MEISSKIISRKFIRFLGGDIRKSLAQPALSKDKPNDFDWIGLTAGISNIGLNFEQKRNIRDEFYYFVRRCGENNFPDYLSLNYRNNLKFDIGEDRAFCKHAGISYVNFDKHRVDIDLALAVFYIRQMKEFFNI